MTRAAGLAITHPIKGVETDGLDRLLDITKKEALWLGDKALARPILTFLKWVQVWKKSQGGDLSGTQNKIMNLAEDGKMFAGVVAGGEVALEFSRAVKSFIKSPSWQSLHTMTVKGSAIGAPVSDLYDIVKKHITTDIPGAVTTVVKGFGPAAMVYGFSDFTRKNIVDITKETKAIADTKLHKAKGKDRIKKMPIVRNALIRMGKSFIDLAFSTSYLALGVLLFCMFWFSLSVASWVPLALATVALISQITAKFWDKILVQAIPPEKGHKKA